MLSLTTTPAQHQVRKWDAETGKLLQEAQIHDDAIQDMQLAPNDGSYVVTASLDRTAQLVDVPTLTSLKTYKTGRYVQSAAVSPLYDHVLLGGGQDAAQVGLGYAERVAVDRRKQAGAQGFRVKAAACLSSCRLLGTFMHCCASPTTLVCVQVTTTAAKAGGFEARFYHKIYAEEFGNVRGHFGPINTVAFSPDGRSFTTGGEDGYVRIHHFGEFGGGGVVRG